MYQCAIDHLLIVLAEQNAELIEWIDKNARNAKNPDRCGYYRRHLIYNGQIAKMIDQIEKTQLAIAVLERLNQE
jgi:hypothetical protein